MKQEQQKKKNKLWLWIVIALMALLVVVGIVAAFILPGMLGTSSGAVVDPKLYWNLDRKQWLDPETNMSAREMGEDGYYHISYLVDGQVTDMKIVADKRLVNYLDAQDALCLVLDKNGVVVDAVDATEYFTLAAKDVYVKRCRNNMLEANSSTAMSGMVLNYMLDGTFGPYNVKEDAEEPGAVIEPTWLDVITVYTDDEGDPVAIYVTDNVYVEAEIAWRADRYYASGATTRVPNEDGTYTIPFAIKGELVYRTCLNEEVASIIDRREVDNAGMALVYNEDGYIIDFEEVTRGMQGYLLCDRFTVDSVDGNTVYASRHLAGTNVGNTVEFTLDETCEIYQVCSGYCQEDHFGEAVDTLQVGDTFTAYMDLDNKPCLIHISRRTVDVPMYYNLSGMKYDREKQETTREPDEDGYYTYEMAVRGKVKTVRTKSKAIASQIDSVGNYCMGLEVQGSIVKRFYQNGCVCGRKVACSGSHFITSIAGSIITYVNSSDLLNMTNVILTPDCEIYNVSSNYGLTQGAKTELKVGDRITAFMNMRGEITHVFVTQRYYPNHTLCYNMVRKYDSVTQSTTREKDADGYYVYDLAVNGAVKQYKTKNKKLADFIDSLALLGVKLSGNKITSACRPASAVEYGVQYYSGGRVKSMTDGKVISYYMQNGEPVEYVNAYNLSNSTKVYNVSETYSKQPGEKTKLKLEDRFYGVINGSTGEIVYIAIVNRLNDSGIYYHTTRYYSSETGSTRVQDADGYYVYQLVADGKIKEFKTKDKAIADAVDKQTLGFGLLLKKGTNIITQCLASASTKYYNTTTANSDVTSIKGNTVSVRRCRLTSSNYGAEGILKISKKTIVVDVSSYAENYGAVTKLSVGDRIVGYADGDGVTDYLFVTKKAVREKGVFGYCDHCKKTVFWDAYSEYFLADAHYYLPADTVRTSTLRLGILSDEEKYTSVFDLNGHTLTAPGATMTINDNIILIDSVGTGKLVGGTATTYDNIKQGGNVYVSEGASFTLQSGTIENGSASPIGMGGNIAANNGTVVISGGKITGGTAYLGTAIYHSGAKGGIKITGGEIDGTVYAEESGKITLSGKPVVDTLIVAPGNKIKLGELKSGASITVKAEGVFTTNCDNAEACKKYFKTADPADKIVVEGKALKYINNSGAVLSVTSNANAALELDKNGEGMCNVCGQKVKWIAVRDGEVIGNQAPFQGDNVTANPNFDADRFTEAGSAKYHFYIAEDMTSGAEEFLYAYRGNRTCIHLNGKTLNLQGGIYAGNGSVVNIFGQGTVNRLALANGSKAKSSVVECDTGEVNVYGGVFTSATSFAKTGSDNAKLTVALDADVRATTELSKGKITLAGGVVTKNINIGETAQLIVHKNFSGEAIIRVNAGLVNNMVPEENAQVLGKYSGKLTYVDLRPVTYKNGRLVVTGEAPSVNTALSLDENNVGFCYVCGEKVNWTPITNRGYIGSQDTDATINGAKVHYYLAEDIVSANCDFLFAYRGVKTCLHLNGKTANLVGGIYAGNGAQVNIMGKGTVNALCNATNGDSANNMFTVWTATINLYGGTYESNGGFIKFAGDNAKVSILEDAKVNETVLLERGYLTVGGKANIQKLVATGGLLTVNNGFAGSAMVDFDAALVDAQTGMINRANATTNGSFKDGVLFTSAGKIIKAVKNDTALVITPDTVTPPAFTDDPINDDILPGDEPGPKLDPNAALEIDENGEGMCNVCGEVVTWVPLHNDESIGTKDLNNGGASVKYHYYLADDNMTSANGDFIYTKNGAQVCLHLNGKFANIKGGIYAGHASPGGSGVVNIMGAGTLNHLGTDVSGRAQTNMFFLETGVIKLYGGTYESNFNFLDTHASKANFSILEAADVNETVTVTQGKLFIGGNANIEKVVVTGGLLTVNNGFAGSAMVDFDAALVDAATGLINRDNATTTGTFTDGAVFTSAGKVIKAVQNDNALVITPDTVTPPPITDAPIGVVVVDRNADLVLDSEKKGMCHVCDEEVTWVPLTEGMALTDVSFTSGTKYHYYVDGPATDVTVGNHATRGFLARIATSASVCLHLNNHNMVSPGTIWLVAGAKLNIMGKGTVTYTASAASSDGVNVAFIYAERSTVTLYGGTYELSGAAKTNNYPIYLVKSNRQNLTVTDTAQVNGIVDCGLYTNALVLDGASYIKELIVNDSTDAQASAYFTVNANFSGTVDLLSFTKGFTNGVTTIGKSDGFNGTINTALGKLIAKDGILILAPGPNSDLVLDEQKKGMCNVCGETVTWTPLTAGMNLGTSFTSGEKYHYYVDGTETDVTVGAHTRGTLAFVNTGATVCLHLNNHNMVTPGAFYLGTGAKLNIMGKGTVTYTGTAPSSYNPTKNCAFINSSRSTVTLYGGTYNVTGTAQTENKPVYYTDSNRQDLTVCGNATINGIVDCGVFTNKLLVDGNTFIQELVVNDSTDAQTSATFTVNPTFVGTIAKLSFTKGGADGAMVIGKCSSLRGKILTADCRKVVAKNGVLFIEKGVNSPLELDADKKGMCNVCGAIVTWTPLTANNHMGVSFTSGQKYHFYVDGAETDVVVGAHTRGVLAQITSSATVCLHLNGHNMVSKGNFYMSSGATLNIMGSGTITYTGAYPGSYNLPIALIRTDRAFVNLYGGTYVSTDASKPIYWNYSAQSKLTVKGGARIEGIVDCVSTNYTNQQHTASSAGTINTLTIDENAYIQELKFNGANLVVNPTFAGTVSKISFANGIVTAENVITGGKSTGAFSGTITTADGKSVVADNGGLKIVE